MPQVFQVLCCYRCEMFQVHQVKKSNKWQCRGCNAKQSLKKAFKIGTSQDCRFLVQDLNMRKSGLTQEQNENSDSDEYSDNAHHVSDPFERNEREDYSNQSDVNCKFVDTTESYEDDRYSLDFVSDLCKENPAENRNNFLADDDTALANVFNTVEQSERVMDKSVNFENPQECPLETNAIDLFRKNTLPPFMKNRGFQVILNAASKLS